MYYINITITSLSPRTGSNGRNKRKSITPSCSSGSINGGLLEVVEVVVLVMVVVVVVVVIAIVVVEILIA